MRWLLMLVSGALLVTAWAHLPARDIDRVVTARRDAEARYAATLRELQHTEAAYREHARADTLLALLSAQPGLTMKLSSALPDETADSIEAALTRELNDTGALRARIGVFVIDVTYGRTSTFWRTGIGAEREIYVGTDSTGAYCASVSTGLVLDNGELSTPAFGVVRNMPWRRTDHAATVLGPCAFVARYGAPGPHITRWLDGGAWAFADLRDRTVLEDTASTLLLHSSWYDDDNLIRGCGVGRRDMCRQFLMTERDVALAGPGFDLRVYPRRNAAAVLLYELEQQFGPDRFARFWTSEIPVEAAFASAFDVDPLSWTGEWLTSHYRMATIGPLIDVWNVLLSLGVVVVLAGAAMLVASRREI